MGGRIAAGGGRIAGGGGLFAGGGGLFAGGPFAAGLIAGGPFASGLNAAHRTRVPCTNHIITPQCSINCKNSALALFN